MTLTFDTHSTSLTHLGGGGGEGVGVRGRGQGEG